eukprot:c16557_g1_i1.p1 GENE.c16557_g1_i1~~c16557_g1_i1.p1  ORF type:complete len:244 (+),score=111.30 c16557_g1_i1:45-734(+)
MTSTVFRNPRIVALSGSIRTGSVNNLLVNFAARVARNNGAEVEVIDLTHFSLPVYHGDLEASKGLPIEAKQLKEKLDRADGFLITTPEYNGLLSPLLLNTLSWTSRSHEPNETMYKCYKGKSAGILSASPGGLGGMRALRSLREVLTNLGVNVLAEQAAIGGAFSAFNKEGQLSDAKQVEMVSRVAIALVEQSRLTANSSAMCEIARKIKEGKSAGEYGSVSIANMNIV